MFKTYTLYSRSSKKYRKIYYVRFRDPETGERLSGITTNTNKKSEAHRFAQRYIEDGKLISKKDAIFSEYTKDWFCWKNENPRY